MLEEVKVEKGEAIREQDFKKIVSKHQAILFTYRNNNN